MTPVSQPGRQMHMWRALVLLVVSMLGSGCATLWTVFEVADVDWHQGRFTDKTEPLGPIESDLVVRGTYEKPPPPPRVEAARLGDEEEFVPGPVVIAPYPSPPPVEVGRPLPQGGVSFSCKVLSRASKERRHDTLYRYDGVFRVLAVFMFLAEGAMGGLAMYATTQQKNPQWGWFGFGAYMGLDAIGSLILAFHPKQELKRVVEGPGEWREKPGCPEGLGVETETGTFRVESDGHVDTLEPWLLQRLVEADDATVPLSFRGQVKPYEPGHESRCAWSAWAKSPAPYCRGWADTPYTEAVHFTVLPGASGK